MKWCMTKSTKWPVHPEKTLISLSIHPVWSVSSLFAWRKLGSLATHWVHSEDWSDWADAQADLSLRWAHRSFCLFCLAAAQIRILKTKKWNLAVSRAYLISPAQSINKLKVIGQLIFVKILSVKIILINPSPDIVKINAFAKFAQIPSIYSQDIELKRNSDINQGPWLSY